MAKKIKKFVGGGNTQYPEYQQELNDLYEYGVTDKQIQDAKKKSEEIKSKFDIENYKSKDVSSKKPEPTFKSDVDNIVSGVKKGYTKIDDTLNKGFAKAAGKTEKGILNTSISKDYKKGGMIKKYSKGGTASARADGIATKGKTKGRII